jgi:hypothetical protein
MRENLGVKSFQQALIPYELKIIRKVLREIYTPQGVQGGVGYPFLGYRPFTSLTDLTDEGFRAHFFYLPVCGSGG